MTDDASRIARLEERMQDVEDWVTKHEDLGTDVSLLKKCIETYNGDIKTISNDVKSMHDTLTDWKGSIKVFKWLLGGVGGLTIIQVVLATVGL